MSSSVEEIAFFFPCEEDELLGIIAAPAAQATAGMLIIVGGPQYRVGGHRLFVHLARGVAQSGTPTMRFDYRGMGDSTGAMRSFEDIDSDVRAAIDAFLARCPQLRSVVLWGICGGVTAACYYAATDPRVSGVVLVNPWVRTESGQARTQLRHYYVRRILDAAFWRKLLRGHLHLGKAIAGFLQAIGRLRSTGERSAQSQLALPERMATTLLKFRGRILVVLSGNDYTAKEFSAAWAASSTWRHALASARTLSFEEADHTFSNPKLKTRVVEATAAWVSEMRTDHARVPRRSPIELHSVPQEKLNLPRT